MTDRLGREAARWTGYMIVRFMICLRPIEMQTGSQYQCNWVVIFVESLNGIHTYVLIMSGRLPDHYLLSRCLLLIAFLPQKNVLHTTENFAPRRPAVLINVFHAVEVPGLVSGHHGFCDFAA